MANGCKAKNISSTMEETLDQAHFGFMAYASNYSSKRNAKIP